MKRSDKSFAVACLFQSLAQDGDVLRQIGFFYCLVRPDMFEQLILAHDASVVFNQDKQSLEHLRSQGDGGVTTAKGPRLGVQGVAIKAKDHICYSVVEIWPCGAVFRFSNR